MCICIMFVLVRVFHRIRTHPHTPTNTFTNTLWSTVALCVPVVSSGHCLTAKFNRCKYNCEWIWIEKMISFWVLILGSFLGPTRIQKQYVRPQNWGRFLTNNGVTFLYMSGCLSPRLANFQSPPSSESLCPSASGAFAAGQKSVWKIVHLVCSVPRPILVQLCHHVPR